MNSLMENKWSWVEGANQMRDAVLDSLSDADLSFSQGGQAMPLGALFREQGEIEHSYAESFKTLTQTSFDYHSAEAGVENSVSRLKAWFQKLDGDLKEALSAFSNEDLSKTVERASGYGMPVEMQFDVYLQATLIFLGKATIYLRAMNKPLPQAVQEWIG
jgi:hypothetical protein